MIPLFRITAVACRQRQPMILRSPGAGGIGTSSRQAFLWDLILMAVAEAVGDRGQSSADEVDLVRGMGSHDGDNAELVYRRYSERVLRYIYYRVGEQLQDAEELTLDTFMTAMELCRGYDGRVPIFVWLCGIAKLRIIDFYRRKKAHKRGGGGSDISLDDFIDSHDGDNHNGRTPMEEALDRIGASQVLDLALRTVSEDEREALLLQQIDGLSVREISLRLKRSEDAVESLIRRAKLKLRTVIAGLLGEEAGR